jgi:hypothetical protein
MGPRVRIASNNTILAFQRADHGMHPTHKAEFSYFRPKEDRVEDESSLCGVLACNHKHSSSAAKTANSSGTTREQPCRRRLPWHSRGACSYRLKSRLVGAPSLRSLPLPAPVCGVSARLYASSSISRIEQTTVDFVGHGATGILATSLLDLVRHRDTSNPSPTSSATRICDWSSAAGCIGAKPRSKSKVSIALLSRRWLKQEPDSAFFLPTYSTWSRGLCLLLGNLESAFFVWLFLLPTYSTWTLSIRASGISVLWAAPIVVWPCDFIDARCKGRSSISLSVVQYEGHFRLPSKDRFSGDMKRTRRKHSHRWTVFILDMNRMYQGNNTRTKLTITNHHVPLQPVDGNGG